MDDGGMNAVTWWHDELVTDDMRDQAWLALHEGCDECPCGEIDCPIAEAA